MKFHFCPLCGASVHYLSPPGDHHKRAVCQSCNTIHYQNPNVVVGAVAFWEQKVLLCRRSIEPRTGYWTIPAGFLELDETSEEGACREAFEEANAHLSIRRLLAVYDLPHISQVLIFYLADLISQDIFPGPESQAVGLFPWSEIPWQELAFPSVHWALKHAEHMYWKEELMPDRRSKDLNLEQFL